jgi:heptosyltransferase-2
MESRHQQWENALILLGNELPDFLPSPQLIPPDTAKDTVCEWLADLPRPLLGLLPGAARGPSKQWPAERFLAVARTWQSDIGGTAVWMGTPNDRELCRNLAERCGPPSTSFAGDTSLPEFTALLAAMQAVVANDSGGMHLAAAVGTPVVGIFGQTDPGKTAPLHPQAVVVKAKGSSHRAIRREDPAAVKALASIPVEEVLEPVLAFADSRA